jgi:hypothetical protein
MVKTSKGMIGWVQATDVSGSTRLDETFKDTISEIRPQDKTTSSEFLSKCLKHADSAHENAWAEACDLNGMRGCRGLPNAVADSLMRDHRAARDECIKLHTTKSITGK